VLGQLGNASIAGSAVTSDISANQVLGQLYRADISGSRVKVSPHTFDLIGPILSMAESIITLPDASSGIYSVFVSDPSDSTFDLSTIVFYDGNFWNGGASNAAGLSIYPSSDFIDLLLQNNTGGTITGPISIQYFMMGSLG
jgi:hypothetical protein